MVSLYLYLALLALVGIERLVELRISRRNAAWAVAQGGREVGQGHFVTVKLLHTGFLLGCAADRVASCGIQTTWRSLPEASPCPW